MNKRNQLQEQQNHQFSNQIMNQLITYIHFIQQTTKHVFGYIQQIQQRQTE